MNKKLVVSLFLLCPLLVAAQSLEVRPDKKGRLGYFDSDGKNVISCQFEEAEPFVDGLARVRKDGKYGFIDEKGKSVGGKYTVMEEFANTAFLLVADGGSEAKPKDKIPTRISIPAKIFKGSTYYPVKGAKWGIIDKRGNVLIKPEYDEISNPISGVIYVSKGGKFGFYDEDLNLVLKPTYNAIGAFNNQGLCWVKNGCKMVKGGYVTGGKMGIIDRQGKLLVPLKYESVSTFAPSEDAVYSSSPIKALQSVPFQPMPDSEESCLWFASKGIVKPGVMGIDGTVLIPEKKYDEIYMPTDGMAKFAVFDKKTKSKKWGYYNVDAQKETYTDAEYVFYPFYNGVSKAARNDNNLYYFVDREFHEISERYTKAFDFVEDYCVVGRGNKFGVLDRSGKEVIPLEYADTKTHFSEGLLGVCKDGKWGFVTPDNTLQIPLEYDAVGFHQNGCATVKLGDKFGQIDVNNHVILPIEWKNFYIPPVLPSDYYWVQKADDLYYYYDMKSHQVAYPVSGKGFSEVEAFNENGYARVKSAFSFGAIHKDGSEYVPCKFDKKADVDKAVNYLHKNSLSGFKEVDLRRFKIILRGTCNSHTLSERIPADDWDY